MRGNRGFALVLVLVVTALMVAVTTELIHQVYVDTSLSRGFRDGQQASLLAESGVTAGAKYLKWSFSGDTTSLADPLKQEDETGTIEIRMIEESGKLNLNLLVTADGNFNQKTYNALLRLGKRLEIPEDVWSALADWLDSNDDQRSGGAETPYYQTLKPPYRARNGKMATLAELSLVKGFTPEILARLKPFVTVYSEQTSTMITSQQININTAPLEVLTALSDSIDDAMASRIVAERQRNPFKNTDNVSRLSGGAAIAQELTGVLTYKGAIFRITSISKVKDSARTVDAVVRLADEKILSWQEY